MCDVLGVCVCVCGGGGGGVGVVTRFLNDNFMVNIDN